MARGVRKEVSDVTESTRDQATVVGDYETLAKAWKAIVAHDSSGRDGLEPRVVRLGKKWYLAYLLPAELV